VYQVDTSHHLEQLAHDMGAAPAAGRGHVDLARIGIRIGDELGDGPGREKQKLFLSK
jgi:hypothetical protein